MLDPLVLAALVALVKVIFDTYLPQFPVSAELITAVIVFLLGLFTKNLLVAGIKKVSPKTYEMLLKPEE